MRVIRIKHKGGNTDCASVFQEMQKFGEKRGLSQVSDAIFALFLFWVCDLPVLRSCLAFLPLLRLFHSKASTPPPPPTPLLLPQRRSPVCAVWVLESEYVWPGILASPRADCATWCKFLLSFLVYKVLIIMVPGF